MIWAIIGTYVTYIQQSHFFCMSYYVMKKKPGRDVVMNFCA